MSAEVKLTHADVQSTNIQDYPAKSVTFGMKFEVIIFFRAAETMFFVKIFRQLFHPVVQNLCSVEHL